MGRINSFHRSTRNVLQDKSSRFVLAKSDIISAKVDKGMNDGLRYEKVEEDDMSKILKRILEWYGKRKKTLSVVDEDISGWLVNSDSQPGKVKVLIKTHNPDMPVREVFSVCSQPVEKLSSFFQFSYLGPIVNYGVLKWRLKDTNEFIRFLHPVNDHLFQNKVKSMPSTCSIDIIDIKNLILGSILNFWGPNAVLLGLGQG